jgi:hypothetical protein
MALTAIALIVAEQHSRKRTRRGNPKATIVQVGFLRITLSRNLFPNHFSQNSSSKMESWQ